MAEAEKMTTIPAALSTNERLKKLGAGRAKKMGLTKPFPPRVFLEMLVNEEEERIKHEQRS